MRGRTGRQTSGLGGAPLIKFQDVSVWPLHPLDPVLMATLTEQTLRRKASLGDGRQALHNRLFVLAVGRGRHAG